MLKEERRTLIIKIIDENGFVKNVTLSEMTNSTIQTIISDINELHNEGKVIKVYGGAKTNKSNSNKIREQFEEEKAALNIDLKDKIAKEACSLIEDGDLIFLDTGTTTRQMIKYLSNKKNINIVTNGYSIALELMEQDMEVCLIGGIILPKTHAMVGELSLKFLDNFYFDKVFLGMNGYDKSNFYTTNIQEAMIKEKAIKNSNKSFILMDSSKINSKNKIKVSTTNNTVLITDK